MNLQKYMCCLLLLGYLVGVHQGRIALWQGEDPEPIYVSPYSASSLPKADQTALEQGIPIQSKEDLIRLMEDFCS